MPTIALGDRRLCSPSPGIRAASASLALHGTHRVDGGFVPACHVRRERRLPGGTFAGWARTAGHVEFRPAHSPGRRLIWAVFMRALKQRRRTEASWLFKSDGSGSLEERRPLVDSDRAIKTTISRDSVKQVRSQPTSRINVTKRGHDFLSVLDAERTLLERRRTSRRQQTVRYSRGCRLQSRWGAACRDWRQTMSDRTNRSRPFKMNPPENSVAFGAPGIEPRWTSSAKEGVGTAYHTGAGSGSRLATASSTRFTIHASISRHARLSVLITDAKPFHEENATSTTCRIPRPDCFFTV